MNTSYNYADFIGLNLDVIKMKTPYEESEIKKQDKPQPSNNVDRFNDKLHKKQPPK